MSRAKKETRGGYMSGILTALSETYREVVKGEPVQERLALPVLNARAELTKLPEVQSTFRGKCEVLKGLQKEVARRERLIRYNEIRISPDSVPKSEKPWFAKLEYQFSSEIDYFCRAQELGSSDENLELAMSNALKYLEEANATISARYQALLETVQSRSQDKGTSDRD